MIIDSGVKSLFLHRENVNIADYAIIYNTLQKDNSNSEQEAVEQIYRQLRNTEAPDDETARDIIQKLFFSDKRYDLGEVGRYRINKKLGLDTNWDAKVLTNEDIVLIVKYLIGLINSKAVVDDIDHLSNRRVRTVGEQLYAQFGVGLARMARTIKERMNVRDNEDFKPVDLINARTLVFCDQLVLRYKPAVSVHGPDQPAGRSDAQASCVCTGARWSIKRACRFRST